MEGPPWVLRVATILALVRCSWKLTERERERERELILNHPQDSRVAALPKPGNVVSNQIHPIVFLVVVQSCSLVVRIIGIPAPDSEYNQPQASLPDITQ